MTVESELTEAPATAPTDISRGGSYVTLPPGSEVSPKLEGSYVTVPGALPGHGNRAQGTYVTLPAAPAGATEISYARVG